MAEDVPTPEGSPAVQAQGGTRWDRAERLLPWALTGWAGFLFLVVLLFYEALELDQGYARNAPVVFLLAFPTAVLVVTALVLAVRKALRSLGVVRFAWVLVAGALVLVSLPALQNLTFVDDDDPDDPCHRWGVLPTDTFSFMAFVPWRLFAGLGLTLGVLSLPMLAWRPTRRAGACLLGTFALGLQLTIGVLDGCFDA